MNSIDCVLRVVSALEKLAIPYMVVGSFSSNVYGKPRSTKDADFVIELADKTISALAAEIGSDFVLDPQMSFESITSTLRYRLSHRDTAFMIELFLTSSDAHDQSRFARRISGPIGNGQRAFVPTAEDVIITKLRWSKQGRRQKDIADVEGILAVQSGQLDLPYIRHWTDQHGTRELFEKPLKAVQDLP